MARPQAVARYGDLIYSKPRHLCSYLEDQHLDTRMSPLRRKPVTVVDNKRHQVVVAMVNMIIYIRMLL